MRLSTQSYSWLRFITVTQEGYATGSAWKKIQVVSKGMYVWAFYALYFSWEVTEYTLSLHDKKKNCSNTYVTLLSRVVSLRLRDYSFYWWQSLRHSLPSNYPNYRLPEKSMRHSKTSLSVIKCFRRLQMLASGQPCKQALLNIAALGLLC